MSSEQQRRAQRLGLTWSPAVSALLRGIGVPVLTSLQFQANPRLMLVNSRAMPGVTLMAGSCSSPSRGPGPVLGRLGAVPGESVSLPSVLGATVLPDVFPGCRSVRVALSPGRLLRYREGVMCCPGFSTARSLSASSVAPSLAWYNCKMVFYLLIYMCTAHCKIPVSFRII